MVLLVVDTQKLITNEELYQFKLFENRIKILIAKARECGVEVICIDATVKCGFEHGFRMIVPEYTNSTFDNAFMIAEQTYRYYNDFMWKGRYAECVSFEEALALLR